MFGGFKDRLIEGYISESVDVADKFADRFSLKKAYSLTYSQDQLFRSYFAGFYARKRGNHLSRESSSPTAEALSKIPILNLLTKSLDLLLNVNELAAQRMLGFAATTEEFMSNNPNLTYIRLYARATRGNIREIKKEVLDKNPKPTDIDLRMRAGNPADIRAAAHMLSSAVQEATVYPNSPNWDAMERDIFNNLSKIQIQGKSYRQSALDT